MNSWLLLLYKVPTEPSARRVYVWRKLKSLGAVLLQDAAWVLPANPRTREHFEWLAAEIEEMNGTATLWESRLYRTHREQDLIAQFEAQVDAGYAELLQELAGAEADLAGIARRYQQLRRQDYFRSALGKQVYAALMTVKGEDGE